ncbi:MAG: glycosyltransferase family 39 protein [Desulfobacteraceae bacterium]|nr:glycosyltransferase family 39 protein [Desulfobacteraceae bacterium]
MTKNNNSPNIRVLTIIFFLALALRLVVVFMLPTPRLLSDDRQYSELGVSIGQGKGFTLCIGSTILAAQIVRAFLLALTSVVIFFLGRLIFNQQVGYFAVGVAGVYPLLIFPAYQLNSEILFVFLFTFSLFFVLKARENCWFLLLVDLPLALSSLTKPATNFDRTERYASYCPTWSHDGLTR